MKQSGPPVVFIFYTPVMDQFVPVDLRHHGRQISVVILQITSLANNLILNVKFVVNISLRRNGECHYFLYLM